MPSRNLRLILGRTAVAGDVNGNWQVEGAALSDVAAML